MRVTAKNACVCGEVHDWANHVGAAFSAIRHYNPFQSANHEILGPTCVNQVSLPHLSLADSARVLPWFANRNMRTWTLPKRRGGALWTVQSLRLRVARFHRGPILILRHLPNRADHRVRHDDLPGPLLHQVPVEIAQNQIAEKAKKANYDRLGSA